MTANIPKREEERRRRNKTTEAGAPITVERVVADPALLADTSLVPAPSPNPRWHPIAMMTYEAAKRSAIRDFYEPTDWAQLFIVCETIHRAMSDQVKPMVVSRGELEGSEIIDHPIQNPVIDGGTLNAINRALASLMFSEGERRKVRLQVERLADPTIMPQATGENVIQLRMGRLGEQ